MLKKQTKIDKLINKLCPDGVEFKELGSFTKINTGTQLNRAAMIKGGKYPVLNGGKDFSGYYNSYNTKADTISVSQGGASAGFVTFMKKNFWAGAHCFIIEPSSKDILNKFVYYFLKSKECELMNAKLGAGIPGLNKNVLKKLKIPIPPIEIQKEIVKILDNFTELEAELEAELEDRKKQYEYYREKVLTFGDDVEFKELGEVCEVASGGTPSRSKKEFWENGTIPWLKSESCKNQSVYNATNHITKIGLKNSSTKLLNKNTTLIALVGATIFKTAFLKFSACTNQNIASIKSKEELKLNNKFIFYYITNLYSKLKNDMKYYGMLNLTTLRRFKIPIPPLSKQKEIVAILDKFDALLNDISQGLPAELKARRQQYEYYREKLLTFKEKIKDE